MNKFLIGICAVVFAFSAGMAKSKDEADLVRVKSAAVVVKTEQSDPSEKTGDLTAGTEVQMLKKGNARSLVSAGGVRGWIDNSFLEIIKGGGTTRTLKDVDVQGWLDNPTAVYILDNSSPEVTTLPLDRSFASDIAETKDREDVERSYDENN